jgi:hypothetical protein
MAHTHFPADADKPDFFNKRPDYTSALARGVDLRFLYNEPSGVSEGFTIGEHTSKVLNVFESQKKFTAFQSIHAPPGVGDLEKVMDYTLALHDIGKSIAYNGGDKHQEILFSSPIAHKVMSSLHFSPQEANLTVALINTHQDIGEVMKAGSSASPALVMKTYSNIVTNAKSANMNPADFFKLMKLFYVSDAGGYPALMSGVFEPEASGKIVPRDISTFRKLASKFGPLPKDDAAVY